jgi:hypothetical protein
MKIKKLQAANKKKFLTNHLDNVLIWNSIFLYLTSEVDFGEYILQSCASSSHLHVWCFCDYTTFLFTVVCTGFHGDVVLHLVSYLNFLSQIKQLNLQKRFLVKPLRAFRTSVFLVHQYLILLDEIILHSVHERSTAASAPGSRPLHAVSWPNQHACCFTLKQYLGGRAKTKQKITCRFFTDRRQHLGRVCEGGCLPTRPRLPSQSQVVQFIMFASLYFVGQAKTSSCLCSITQPGQSTG